MIWLPAGFLRFYCFPEVYDGGFRDLKFTNCPLFGWGDDDVLFKLHNIFMILFLLEKTHLFTISPEVSPDIPAQGFSLELTVFWSEGCGFCFCLLFFLVRLHHETESSVSPQVQSSKGETDVNESPPSILQLAFASLHVGLTHVDANGEIMVSTPEIYRNSVWFKSNDSFV